MQPWEHAIPPILYKYRTPDRVDALASCRVRFSPRTAFEDERELRPEFTAFGTESEIWRFVLKNGIQLAHPLKPHNILVKEIAENPTYQQQALKAADSNIKSRDELGIFCLTEAPDSEQMWADYADNGRGFVIAFDTTHAGFGQLKTPGRMGKVTYSDVAFETLLGAMETEGGAILFRKRMKYAFEREWRSVRFFSRLERGDGDIYISGFNPASIREIIIRPGCAIEAALRQIVVEDARYKHVQITVQR